jgi:hypothetical protein
MLDILKYCCYDSYLHVFPATFSIIIVYATSVRTQLNFTGFRNEFLEHIFSIATFVTRGNQHLFIVRI